MKRATFNILFYVKRTKLLKTGEAPVYMRITLNSMASEVSLKRSIKPTLWDTTRNKAKGNSEDSQRLNDYLTSIRGQIYLIQKDLQECNKEITPNALLNVFQGKGEKKPSLMELFNDHNLKMSNLIGKDFSALTLQRYATALKHLSIFLEIEYKKKDIHLNEVNNTFILAFEYYLKTTANCAHNSAMKHIKALKKIIRIALANDYIKKDPFLNFSISTDEVIRECLTETELNKLIEKEFSIKRIEIVRDLFIFQCYTGLAYTDLLSLKKENIQKGIDGFDWIVLRRGKTGTECRIPVLPIASKILLKYTYNHKLPAGKLLPVPSNQKMNAYLKEVADLCGIRKTLHTHLARHSFASTVTLGNGVPIETISKLLGHTKLQTTQIYAKVSDRKISSDMYDLRQRIS